MDERMPLVANGETKACDAEQRESAQPVGQSAKDLLERDGLLRPCDWPPSLAPSGVTPGLVFHRPASCTCRTIAKSGPIEVWAKTALGTESMIRPSHEAGFALGDFVCIGGPAEAFVRRFRNLGQIVCLGRRLGTQQKRGFNCSHYVSD